MTESTKSGTDPGPGVFSLTQIRHLMRVEFGRAQRYGYPVSCVVLACDRLGHLRDLYGYEFREAVLDEVVHLLHRTFRACDYLGRLMDDRLMTILPHTTRAGAERSAERILAAARGLEFRAEDTPIQVTLSIGISHFENENTIFFDSLVEAAEAALGEARAGGGDRLVYRSPGARGGPAGD
jgi:diguanylate cyclase (GGDEF)-like protein